MRDLLGGKGANVAEMTRVLGAERVPAGFTDHHRGLRRLHERRPAGARGHGRAGRRGARSASRSRPASGSATPRTRCSSPCARARASRCPGCSTRSSTSGLNDESVEGLAEQTENERFAWDSYRRFVQMFGNVVARDRRARRSRTRSRRSRQDRGVEDDTELDVDALKALTDRFKALYKEHTGEDFPQDPQEQLRAGDPRGVRLLDRRARRRLPAHQPHPRRLGHGGQRPADGVRQQGRRRRAPASRSAATR